MFDPIQWKQSILSLSNLVIEKTIPTTCRLWKPWKATSNAIDGGKRAVIFFFIVGRFHISVRTLIFRAWTQWVNKKNYIFRSVRFWASFVAFLERRAIVAELHGWINGRIFICVGGQIKFIVENVWLAAFDRNLCYDETFFCRIQCVKCVWYGHLRYAANDCNIA